MNTGNITIAARDEEAGRLLTAINRTQGNAEPKGFRETSDDNILEIFEAFDVLFQKGKFRAVDALFRELSPAKIPTDALITILTATGVEAVKSKLMGREQFLERARAAIVERGEMKPGLLDGLI